MISVSRKPEVLGYVKVIAAEDDESLEQVFAYAGSRPLEIYQTNGCRRRTVLPTLPVRPLRRGAKQISFHEVELNGKVYSLHSRILFSFLTWVFHIVGDTSRDTRHTIMLTLNTDDPQPERLSWASDGIRKCD